MTCSTSRRPETSPLWSCGSACSRGPAALAVTGRLGDSLALRVAAPPIGGRANAESLELVAELLGVRKSQVELVAGEKNRQKRFRVAGVDPDRARDVIARELRSATARPSPRDRPDNAGRSRP